MSAERDPNELTPVFTEAEEAVVKVAHEKLDQELGINNKTPEHLVALFEKRLERLYPAEEIKPLLSWKALIAYICAAFALGMTTARVAMLPAMEVTRSVGPLTELARDGEYAQKVVVKVDDPIATAQLVSNEAIKLGLKVIVEHDQSTYLILVDGFVPYSTDQEVLRNALGLNKTVSGRILFSLTK